MSRSIPDRASKGMSDGDADLDLVLERVITAPLTARSAVHRLLSGPKDDAFAQLALLATSEVVTHALTRGAGPCQLRAWHVPASGWLRIEVTDHASAHLRPISIGPTDTPAAPAHDHSETDDHGEGDANDVDDVGSLRLAVLLEVASAWGVDHTPFGRTTWFEIAR